MIRKIVAVILFLLAFPGFCSDGELNVQFEKGNALYSQGNYSAALDAYLRANRLGRHWKSLFNTGNAYYKLNQFLEAKIYYLRAQRLKPFEPSIEKNIEVVNRQFKDRLPETKRDWLLQIVAKIQVFFSLNFLSITLLALVLILNGLILLRLLKGKNKIRLYGISFSLFLLIIVSGYHIYRAEKFHQRTTAVVLKENAELLSGPGENNTILFRIHPGLRVTIMDRSHDWLNVSASSEITGWIKARDLEII